MPARSYVIMMAILSIAASSERWPSHRGHVITLDTRPFSPHGSWCNTVARSSSIGFHVVVSVVSLAISFPQQTGGHCLVRVLLTETILTRTVCGHDCPIVYSIIPVQCSPHCSAKCRRSAYIPCAGSYLASTGRLHRLVMTAAVVEYVGWLVWQIFRKADLVVDLASYSSVTGMCASVG